MNFPLLKLIVRNEIKLVQMKQVPRGCTGSIHVHEGGGGGGEGPTYFFGLKIWVKRSVMYFLGLKVCLIE